MERDENGGESTLALGKRMLEEELLPNIVQRCLDLSSRVVEEEIQKHLTRGTRNDFPNERILQKLLTRRTQNNLPNERRLQLKLLGEVSDTMTGSMLKGINDECLKLALLDSNEDIVACGRESSAKVEILLLDNNANGDENNMTLEKFEGSIIQTGEKKKPHFAKSVYVSLKEGVGDLDGLKLGHDSDRIKQWKCRIGARIAQNLEGTTVQEAWTAPFKVIDRRDRIYDKHYPPLLESEVWRLKEICRNGRPCDRLKKKNIKTLQDFLFWFYVDPEGLKQILGTGDSRWNTIVTHARTGKIDDKKMYSHASSTEPQMRVIYDSVGKLKGVIDNSHFVPIHNLSADKKDRARKLLRSVLEEPSAFGERYDTSFNDEDALLKDFPYISSDTHASPNSSTHQFLNSNNPTLSENIHAYQTAGRALPHLCAGNVAVCRSITESPALLCLAVLLEKGEDEMKYNSAMALMEITAVAEQDSDLRRSAFKPTSPVAKAVVDQFLRIVEKADCQLLIPSIRSIGNLARTFRATETRFIPPLVNLLDHREPKVSCEAALALNKFACPDNFLHDTHCKSIISGGGHKHLIPLIYFGEQMVKIPSFILLCYLAMHVPDSETLAQEDVLIALEWSTKQPYLMQDDAIVTLVYEAKKRFELYQPYTMC